MAKLLKKTLLTVSMALVLDTGSSATDGITSYPAITGTAQANTAVTIKEGSSVLGTTTADSTGAWSFTPTGLADGAHTLTATQTDMAGNTGTATLSFTLSGTEQTSAKIYYVSPTGSDSNPGTISAPFRTIQTAYSRLAPGDTLYLRQGTYFEPLNLYRTAASGSPFHISGYPGETVIIGGSHQPAGQDLVAITGAYQVVSNLTVVNSQKRGVSIWEAHDVEVKNMIVHDSAYGGIIAAASSLGIIHDIWIHDNIVYDNVLNNASHTADGGWDAGIGIGAARNVVVENNISYQNQGEGIGCYMTDNCAVSSNTIHDNYSVDLYIDNDTNSRFEKNLIYTTGLNQYYREGYPARGITMANEDYRSQYGTNNPSENDTIANNIVVGDRTGFDYGSYGIGGGLQQTTVTNNTFVNTAGPAISIAADAHSGSYIQNNIVSDSNGTTLFYGAASGITFRNNLWNGGSAGAAAGAGDVNADPKFTIGSGMIASNYALQDISPAIDAAIAQNAPLSDYAGTSRPQGFGYDIGAYEYTSSLH